MITLRHFYPCSIYKMYLILYLVRELLTNTVVRGGLKCSMMKTISRSPSNAFSCHNIDEHISGRISENSFTASIPMNLKNVRVLQNITYTPYLNNLTIIVDNPLRKYTCHYMEVQIFFSNSM